MESFSGAIDWGVCLGDWEKVDRILSHEDPVLSMSSWLQFLVTVQGRQETKPSNDENFTLKLPPLAFLHLHHPISFRKSFPQRSLSRDSWSLPSVHHSSVRLKRWICTLFQTLMSRLPRGNRFLLTESASLSSFSVGGEAKQWADWGV